MGLPCNISIPFVEPPVRVEFGSVGASVFRVVMHVDNTEINAKGMHVSDRP